MAQCDVFPNPSRSGADGIPYVVVIQSELLDGLATRLTGPLAELSFAGKVPTALCPVITVKGQCLHALAHYAAPLPARIDTSGGQRGNAGQRAGGGDGCRAVGHLMDRSSSN